MDKMILKIFIVSFLFAASLPASGYNSHQNNTDIPTTWYEQNSGVTTSLRSVSAPDINNVWVCGSAGVILRTTDGGTWVSASGNLGVINLYTIYAFDANNALVAAAADSGAFAYRTSNGGTNWIRVFTNRFTLAFINSWYFKDENNGLMICDPDSSVSNNYKTTNGGLNWSPVGARFPTYFGSYPSSIYGNGNMVYYGTDDSIIFKTIDFGINWIAVPTPLRHGTISMWFNSANNCFICGVNTIAQTTNGGDIFTINSGLGSQIWVYGVTGTTNGNYWIASKNQIHYTSNNGTNWNAATTQTGDYRAITKARTGSPYLYAVRNNGGISKFGGTYTEIQQITSETKKDFSLSQNYPNPFNPVTKINFSIPKQTQVTLKVFDIPGREVSQLINQELTANNYSVNFDGSKLSSGIYFYKLETPEYHEIKRMVLVK